MSRQAGIFHRTSAFDKAVINLPEGKTFSIVVKNNGKKNKYIESVLLNGKALNIPFFNHQDIANGGTMEIKMTDHPTNGESSLRLSPPKKRNELVQAVQIE